MAVVRVVRKGLCCSPQGLDPEQAARCSETLYEHALVHWQWILLIWHKEKSVHRE
jgi:hypothetical protein